MLCLLTVCICADMNYDNEPLDLSVRRDSAEQEQNNTNGIDTSSIRANKRKRDSNEQSYPLLNKRKRQLDSNERNEQSGSNEQSYPLVDKRKRKLDRNERNKQSGSNEQSYPLVDKRKRKLDRNERNKQSGSNEQSYPLLNKRKRKLDSNERNEQSGSNEQSYPLINERNQSISNDPSFIPLYESIIYNFWLINQTNSLFFAIFSYQLNNVVGQTIHILNSLRKIDIPDQYQYKYVNDDTSAPYTITHIGNVNVLVQKSILFIEYTVKYHDKHNINDVETQLFNDLKEVTEKKILPNDALRGQLIYTTMVRISHVMNISLSNTTACMPYITWAFINQLDILFSNNLGTKILLFPELLSMYGRNTYVLNMSKQRQFILFYIMYHFEIFIHNIKYIIVRNRSQHMLDILMTCRLFAADVYLTPLYAYIIGMHAREIANYVCMNRLLLMFTLMKRSTSAITFILFNYTHAMSLFDYKQLLPATAHLDSRSLDQALHSIETAIVSVLINNWPVFDCFVSNIKMISRQTDSDMIRNISRLYNRLCNCQNNTELFTDMLDELISTVKQMALP